MFRIFSTPRRMEDLALFSRHLAGAMSARVPLPDILRAYVMDAEGGPLERSIVKIADTIEQGTPLSAAMDGYPRVFPAAYRRLVWLGEQGRSLPGMMRQTADRMEDGLKIYESFRRSAAYPLILISILFVIISFLTWKVMPTFQGIFAQLGGEVPNGFFGFSMTDSLLALDLILMVPIFYLLAVVMGLRVWGFGNGRFVLQIPVIGPVMRMAETANFANYLSLLLENRVPLADALGLLADSSSNYYVRSAIEDFHRRFQAGEPLGTLVQNQPLFPPSMAVMIAASEDQGELAETLKHLGRFYNDRTMHGLTVMRELMEPIMLLLVGILIALMVAAFYMPLFQIPKLIR